MLPLTDVLTLVRFPESTGALLSSFAALLLGLDAVAAFCGIVGGFSAEFEVAAAAAASAAAFSLKDTVLTSSKLLDACPTLATFVSSSF